MVFSLLGYYFLGFLFDPESEEITFVPKRRCRISDDGSVNKSGFPYAYQLD
jgi:hypothetical protein